MIRSLPFYNCVAISQTGDPTGAYYRYAFITQADDVDGGYFFPDYPKYGDWSNSYVITTRDFGLIDGYGISVYALEKNKMVNGEPNARASVLPRRQRDPDGHRAMSSSETVCCRPTWTVTAGPLMAPRHRLSARRTMLPVMARHSTHSTFGS